MEDAQKPKMIGEGMADELDRLGSYVEEQVRAIEPYCQEPRLYPEADDVLRSLNSLWGLVRQASTRASILRQREEKFAASTSSARP